MLNDPNSEQVIQGWVENRRLIGITTLDNFWDLIRKLRFPKKVVLSRQDYQWLWERVPLGQHEGTFETLHVKGVEFVYRDHEQPEQVDCSAFQLTDWETHDG